MDRSDNPGMVEREMDETPVEREGMRGSGSVEREGMRGGGMERDSLHGSGSDRDDMSGSSVEREGMRGGAVERDSLAGEHGESRRGMEAGPSHTAGDMDSREGRTGGYGYDRPADIQRGSDRGGADGMTGRPREGEGSPERGMEDDRSRGEDRQVRQETNRDW
ncbi:MAG TPA: hypothetical protein VFQ39_17995 [Longimicrobium sp.]|nr:hypothetical protein [Longimicrobium sp.]